MTQTMTKSQPAVEEALNERAKPPRASVVDALSAENQVLLTQLLTDPIDFVDHSRLSARGADKALFGVETTLVHARATRFEPGTPVVPESKSRASRVPTLSTEQEQLLFLRYNYTRREIAKLLNRASGRRLTAAETRKLLAWGHRMLHVRSEIVQFNMPLVLAMAKRTRLHAIDYNELISEGNVALLRSVEKFDVARGFKFSTYGCRAILKSFSRVAMRASRYRGRFPCEFDPSMERSDHIERVREDVESDCVDELKRILVKNLADLNDVERTVIKERFAITEKPPTSTDLPLPKTLEQVGLIIGVTKERVRQIQNKALRKIRTALETEYLVA